MHFDLTIYNNKIIGHNTDIGGFELAIRHLKYDVNGKKVFILGAGGVVPSIICALKKMKASKIIISNRTKEKAENLKKIFPDIEIIKWGGVPDFDMILNATSLGLEENEEIELNLSKNIKEIILTGVDITSWGEDLKGNLVLQKLFHI